MVSFSPFFFTLPWCIRFLSYIDHWLEMLHSGHIIVDITTLYVNCFPKYLEYCEMRKNTGFSSFVFITWFFIAIHSYIKNSGKAIFLHAVTTWNIDCCSFDCESQGGGFVLPKFITANISPVKGSKWNRLRSSTQ